ncbi:MAG: bifunctional phosphopantothenoylcysteine decarboxylase/phosphopantothenate--cysteine ligase CoaBC [Nitrospiraceae bacterium]|nr:bifunctional phosphopantothenoylcysteine decarboxylase/phosphopantothenate--cysteine ligase CoaBC [Nitrospiraceae bacterium]
MRKRSPLKNKRLLVGVTGSVAAYKAVELVRRMKDEEADVRVAMTSASLNFITPLSLELASGAKPLTGLWEEPLAHVNLAAWAEFFIVAPATANTLGKLANGIADDLLSAFFLAWHGRTLIAPAMNPGMYTHDAFRKNLEFLRSIGVTEIAPETGALACGAEGVGRMAGIESIIEGARSAFIPRDLEGQSILVTAGPTREPLDPVRFISNRSSGKMGFALARAAASRGAAVTLVTGPTALTPPSGIEKLIRVETAKEMMESVLKEAPSSRILVMAAAPADFTPESSSSEKIAKSGRYDLKLKATHDILLEVSRMKRRPFTVGFAAETGPLFERAQEKLRKKDLDMIIFNDVTKAGAGFDCDTNQVSIFGRDAHREDVPVMGKEELAHLLLDRIMVLLPGTNLKANK